MTVPKAYEAELKEIVDKDPLQSMFEQDKELVWQFRLVSNIQFIFYLLCSVNIR